MLNVLIPQVVERTEWTARYELIARVGKLKARHVVTHSIFDFDFNYYFCTRLYIVPTNKFLPTYMRIQFIFLL